MKSNDKLGTLDPELEEGIHVTQIIRKCEKLFDIELVPKFKKIRGSKDKVFQVFRTTVIINSQETKTPRALSNYLTKHENLGTLEHFTIRDRRRSIDLDSKLSKLDSGATLTLSYEALDSTVQFEFVSSENPAQRVRNPVPDGVPVFVVKTAIFPMFGKGHVLPSAISLSFWGTEPSDATVMTHYGIPADSRIDVSTKNAKSLWVIDENQNSSCHQVSKSDTIKSFLEFLGLERGLQTLPSVIVSNCGEEQN